MQEHLIPRDVATKLALSLGVGLLAGFEREWSRKDVGMIGAPAEFTQGLKLSDR
jgi:hypothetical protein